MKMFTLFFKQYCALSLPLLLTPLLSNAQTYIRSDRDSVTFKGEEFVIRSKTSHIRGYLFNAGNGLTAFKTLGQAVQFTVGSGGYPSAGAATYTHAGFKGRQIKVWRNGRQQPVATENGIAFSVSVGTVMFYPALANGEKIYIEALSSIEL